MDKPEVIDDYKWIAIHTYSGYENTVAENIMKIAAGRGMSNQILETCVPKETVITTKIEKRKVTDENGKARKDSEGKVIYQEEKITKEKIVVKYPSYVFVKVGVVFEEHEDGSEEMKLTDVAWYIIRNAKGVTGFVGPNKKPSALSQSEVEEFGLESKVYDINYEVGDTVDVIFGDFKGMRGVVQALDLDNERVKVLLTMFMGSETSVELAFDCVTRSEEL